MRATTTESGKATQFLVIIIKSNSIAPAGTKAKSKNKKLKHGFRQPSFCKYPCWLLPFIAFF